MLTMLASLFSPKAAVRRIFIDEITAVKHWEKALKRLLDRNELPGVLLVTTGSKASDSRHGGMRFPSRRHSGNPTGTSWTSSWHRTNLSKSSAVEPAPWISVGLRKHSHGQD